MDILLTRQFLTFCGIGAINTVIGLSIILFCSEVLGINYIASNIIGYVLGLGLSFFLHKTVTFSGYRHAHSSKHQILWFLLIFAISFLCQIALLIFLVSWYGLNDITAQILAIGLYTVINFAGNRFRTFAER